jgi:hypothetical protein
VSDLSIRPLASGTAAETTAVAARVLTGIDELVGRMGAAYREEVPEYASIGAAEMASEVLPVSRRIVEQFFGAVANGGEADTAQIMDLPEMGRRRLEMGIPLEPMLHVYRIAGRVVWSAIVAATRPGEERVLAELGERWMDFIDRAASLAAAAYLAASHERLRHVDARRRALLDALLSANDPAEVVAVSIQFSTALAATYQPVLVDGDGVHARIDTLLAAAPQGSIGGFRDSRTLLLVPAPADLSPLCRAAGRALVAWGSGAGPGPALLAEVGHVDALLHAARGAGHASGVFGPDDLLVEQLLASNPRVTGTLQRRVADALLGRDHDGLVTSTLRAYLACGSVPETAKREVVHANTVLYRLNRVRALTGLDPRVPADATVLLLGLRSQEVSS